MQPGWAEMAGRKAQHHRWLRLKWELGQSSLAPSPLEKSLTLGERVKGAGVRSLPELSMVVSSTAAVGYARDPFLSTFSLVPSDRASLAPRHGARKQAQSGVPSSGGAVDGAALSPDSHRMTVSHRVSHLETLRSPARGLPHWPLCLPRPCPTCWAYDCPQMLGPEAWMCGRAPGSASGPQAGPREEGTSERCLLCTRPAGGPTEAGWFRGEREPLS